jgi:membrane-associated protease RseP (regulator of RpoE activity)
MTSIGIRSAVMAAVLGLAATAYADDPMYACHEPAANTKITVSFKPSTSLPDLVAWVSGFTCKNVVFSADAERAGQNLTIVAPKPLTPKQALQLFVDSLDTVGLVVTVKTDTITIKLGPKAVPRCTSVASASTVPTPSVDPDADAATDALIAKSIRATDATHYTIAGELIDDIFTNPMAYATAARFVPSTTGFKLYAVRPNKLFAKLGFLNGDAIKSINGYEMTSSDKALEAYKKLRDAKTMTLIIVRRGNEMTLVLSIKR